MLFHYLNLLLLYAVVEGADENQTLSVTTLSHVLTGADFAEGLLGVVSCVEAHLKSNGWEVILDIPFANKSIGHNGENLYKHFKIFENLEASCNSKRILLFASDHAEVHLPPSLLLSWMFNLSLDVNKNVNIMLESVVALGWSDVGVLASSENDYRYMAQILFNTREIYGISIRLHTTFVKKSLDNNYVRQLFTKLKQNDLRIVFLLCSSTTASLFFGLLSGNVALSNEPVWILPASEIDQFENLQVAQQIITFRPVTSSKHTLFNRLGENCGLYRDSLSLKNSKIVNKSRDKQQSYEIILRQHGEEKVMGLWSPKEGSPLFGDIQLMTRIPFQGRSNAGNFSRSVHQVLEVITVASPPFLTVSRDEHGRRVYGGYAFELFETIVKKLEIPVRYRESSSGVFGDRNPVSGLWTGLIGELIDNKADVAVTALTVTPEREEAVTFTPSFFETNIKYVVNSRQVEESLTDYGGYAFAQPFSMKLWLAVCATAVSMAFYLLLVSKLSPYGAYGHYFQSEEAEESNARLARRSSVMTTMRRSSVSLLRRRSSIAYQKPSTLRNRFGHKVSDATTMPSSSVTFQGVSTMSLLPEDDEEFDELDVRRSAQRHMSLSNALFFAFAAMLWQSPETVPRAPSTRIPAGIWYMVGVILITTYTANLVMLASFTMDSTLLLTVRGLVSQNKVPIGTLQDSSVNNLIMSSDLRIAEKVQEAILRNPGKSLQPNQTAAMNLVESGELAFIWDGVILDHIAQNTDCRLTTVDLSFGVSSYGFAFKKHSPYTGRISLELDRLKKTGYLERLREKYFSNTEMCQITKDQILQQQDVPLTYNSMSGAFQFLVIAAGESVILLIIEWVVASWHDVDRADPTKPATFSRAFSLRWHRMLNDAKKNWLPFKKFRHRLWKRWSRRKRLERPKRENTKLGIEANQWKRYISSTDAVNLRPGSSISDPFLQ